MSIFSSETERLEKFPVARNQIFLGHAGVTVLPACACDAMVTQAQASCYNHQEFGDVLKDVERTRIVCAEMIGSDKDEIALLGPTSLGLSLFANGLSWEEGDEIVCYQADYPSNVYPWTALAEKGVKLKFLKPDRPGRITTELVEQALTPRTRLVALASCHYLTGWRIDIDAIGQLLSSKGILFSLDAIQTVGAFPTNVRYVDFLSADAHKWMLGPLAIGIVYVAKRNFARCRPTLLGSWNVESPDFIAQDDIAFPETGRRYEPGVLNISGMYGMKASLEMILEVGLPQVSAAILSARDALEDSLSELGFEFLSPLQDEPLRSGILTARHSTKSSAELFDALSKEKITASLRKAHDGSDWLRFSPHFYNTLEEMQKVASVLKSSL